MPEMLRLQQRGENIYYTPLSEDRHHILIDDMTRESMEKLSGCIHPHRAPGFGNFKPKHLREDGSFPKVGLLQAEKRECAKALELSRGIEREYAEADKARKAHHTQPAAPRTWWPSDAASAYHAHYENIRKHMNVEDFSRVDAMIALRLRAIGHDQQSVVDAIRECGPTIREKNEGRNWQRYAERTAAYAFGVAGDVALAKNE